MKTEEATLYIGKKVQIILKNNFHYRGIVLAVESDTLILKDRFDGHVSVALSQILLLEIKKEEEENHN